MGRFNRGDRFNDRGGDRGRPQMHPAVCSNCGKDCEVPFRPTGDRPIYCSNCFKDVGGSDNRSERSGRSDRREFRRPDRENKKMFQAVCDTCGKDCEVPFQPSAGKPVYCNDCFGKNEGSGSRRSDQSSGQSKEVLDAIHSKLDKILNLLAKPGSEKIVKEAVVKAVKEEKTLVVKPEAKKSADKKVAVKKSKKKLK
ncbi:MAG: hypothetical protein US74_C0021G0007 [Parcubacteria group bacterium GW2011_GWA2_38_13]|nr:MAG: hypothetical protein US74_C0021G0007 [Parcubacteria group bacterium GW2011_GWA2_38_13]